MSIADKLTYLNETKRQLRQAINAAFGAGLTESDSFRSYADFLYGLWTPELLFQDAEQGAWYDPSDLPTLFQDAAGTTSVTADGDPVGLMLDKSGNGSTATQPISASRPVYETDGSKRWLLLDSVSGELVMPPIYGDEDNFVFSIAIKPQAGLYPNPRYFGMVRAGLNLQCGYIDDGTLFTRVAGVPYNTLQKITFGQTYVIQHIRQGGVSSIRVNGQDAGFSSGAVPSSDSILVNSGSLGGGYREVGYKAAGEIYGAIYRHGTISEAQLAAIERYLANKAGVTL